MVEEGEFHLRVDTVGAICSGVQSSSENSKLRVETCMVEKPRDRVEEATLESVDGRVLAVGREDLRPKPETI